VFPSLVSRSVFDEVSGKRVAKQKGESENGILGSSFWAVSLWARKVKGVENAKLFLLLGRLQVPMRISVRNRDDFWNSPQAKRSSSKEWERERERERERESLFWQVTDDDI